MLYSRLFIIAYEECGRDANILRWMYENRPTMKDKAQLETWIKMMALSKRKSNESVGLMFFIKRKAYMHSSIDCPILRKVISLWDDYGYESYEQVGFPSEHEWILELLERTGKQDRESLGVGLPYFYLKELAEEFPIKDDCEPGSLWKDLLPYAAFDQHNRIGNACLNIFHSKTNVSDHLKFRNVGPYIFKNEGMLIVNRLTYPIAFRSHSSENFNKLTDDKRFVNQQLNDIRSWVMEKKYSAEAEYILKYS